MQDNFITRILEDNEEDRDLLRMGLREHGLEDMRDFFLYATSAEMLEDLGPETYVVVLDNRLSEGETGLSILQKLRLERRRSRDDLYIIAITEGAGEDAVIAFLNSQADWFIKKSPTYIAELARVIRIGGEFVRAKRLEKEENEKNKETLKRLIESSNRRLEKYECNEPGANKKPD